MIQTQSNVWHARLSAAELDETRRHDFTGSHVGHALESLARELAAERNLALHLVTRRHP